MRARERQAARAASIFRSFVTRLSPPASILCRFWFRRFPCLCAVVPVMLRVLVALFLYMAMCFAVLVCLRLVHAPETARDRRGWASRFGKRG